MTSDESKLYVLYNSGSRYQDDMKWAGMAKFRDGNEVLFWGTRLLPNGIEFSDQYIGFFEDNVIRFMTSDDEINTNIYGGELVTVEEARLIQEIEGL